MVRKSARASKEGGVTRSTYEAYASMGVAIVQAVFAMSFLMKVALLLLLDAMLIDIFWREERTSSLRWSTKFLLAMMSTIVIAVLALPQLTSDFKNDFLFVADRYTDYFVSYGPIGKITYTPGDATSLRGAQAGEILVNGKLLKHLYGNHQMIGFLLFHGLPGDLKDQPITSRSGAYDISPDNTQMVIPWGDDYKEEITLRGWTGTNYGVLAFPTTVTDKSFNSIREAESKGALLISVRGGPP